MRWIRVQSESNDVSKLLGQPIKRILKDSISMNSKYLIGFNSSKPSTVYFCYKKARAIPRAPRRAEVKAIRKLGNSTLEV
jgi:hypothetical protein